MTSEGLGEVFKGDFADTCAGKFPLVSMGGRANAQACADGERGPPSARVEFIITRHAQFSSPINVMNIYGMQEGRNTNVEIEDRWNVILENIDKIEKANEDYHNRRSK